MSGNNAFGTSLSKGDGAETEVFTAVGNVTSVSGLSLSRESIDVTAHDSTDGWREHIPGLKDGGEVTVDLNFDPNEHVELGLDDFALDANSNWELAFPTGAKWEFSGHVTSDESDAPHDGKLSGSITVKVSGKPTFVPAA